MLKKLLSLCALSLFICSTSMAEETSKNMAKDEWLGKLKAVAPELICKGFFKDDSLNKRLTKLNINYDKCMTLLPPSVEKCQKQYYEKIPTNINKEMAEKWGQTIGECIGKDFAIQHLLVDNPPNT